MAPTRQRKRKSTESTSSVDVQNFPAPPQLVPTKMRSPAKTPTNKSPIRKAPISITAGQKQALIDNLQLEITERARKLRAQYVLQAQGLRTRIDIRVNRIPMALRRANMGELLLKHTENVSKAASSKAAVLRTSPTKSKSSVKTLMEQARASPSPQRSTKRLSDEMATDKENEDIENPKKRHRGPPEPPARTTSKANILSPRSANSQSHTRSPIRAAAAPGKTTLTRPISLLNPAATVPAGGAAGIFTNMVEMAKSTRTTRKAAAPAPLGVGRGKRAAAAAPVPQPKGGRGRAASDSSNTSGSTVIRKHAPAPAHASAPAPKKAPAAAKRTVMGTIKAMGATTKKAPGPKAAAPAAGGRVLRKRN